MEQYINYPILFWLFLLGSVLGVALEGIFCLFFYKKWETHTVAIWGPFCIIYGLGAVGLYIGAIFFENVGKFGQFILFAVIATVIEYICGLVLKNGLHMKAWDYSKNRFNLQGLICLEMSIAWGVLGIIFAEKCVPHLKALSQALNNEMLNIACACLTVFMIINFALTALCIMRWAQRHRGIPPKNRLFSYIDAKYDDAMMSRRFCEWKFIDTV